MVLIAADDQPDRLNELTACLKIAFPDSEISKFTDPGLAVQYSFRNHVDLVFAERFMHRLDGFMVAEGIRFFCPEAMIFLVADQDEKIQNKYRRDVAGILVRPLSAEDIRMKVGKDGKIWENRPRSKNMSAVLHPGTVRNES